MIGIHSRMLLEGDTIVTGSVDLLFFFTPFRYSRLELAAAVVAVATRFNFKFFRAADTTSGQCIGPLHTTKAPLLHRQNSNARVTKAEEAPAAEHREQEEASDKAIIFCTYHSSRSHEVFHALGLP